MKKKIGVPLPEIEMPDAGDLPDGWDLTTLGKIGKWRTGGTPSRKISSYFNGDIPWVKSGDLKDGIVKATDERITESGLQNCAAKLLPVGTVSVALYGATIGKIGILGIEAATNQACANCITDPKKISKEFLFYYILSQRQNLIDAGQGGAQPNLTNQIIHDWPIPLPPLPEQQRIVARVEALLTHVNAARDRLSRVPLIMKKFRQAVLAAACSGRLTDGWREKNSKGISDQINQKILQKMERKKILHNFEWEENFNVPSNWILTFIEIVAKVDTGTTPSRKNADYWDNGSIPWVTSGELYDPFVTDTKEKISEIALKETRLKIFPKGTLLIALYGQGITRGKSSELLIEATTNQACATINVFDDFSAIKPYLKLYLQKNYDDIRRLSTGGVQPNLNLSKIKSMPIPLPPLAEQHEIVRHVGLLFARANAIDREVVAAGWRCERMTQAILAKAFRGELVAHETESGKA